MNKLMTLLALVGVFFSVNVADAGTCKRVVGDNHLWSCSGKAGSWACRDSEKYQFQCISLDDGSEWSTDCPSCEGRPSSRPLKPIQAPSGDDPTAICKYYKHFGTPVADCGDWYCFGGGGGAWSCNDKSGSGTDWSTDCPSCESGKPAPGCETMISAYDDDGREAHACADDGMDHVAAVVQSAGIDGPIDWCVTDDTGVRCGDL